MNVYDCLLSLCGDNKGKCDKFIKMLKCVINECCYNDKPIVHIHNDNIMVPCYIYVIEKLLRKDSYIYLNNVLLCNNISVWYDSNINLCLLTNINDELVRFQSTIVQYASDNVLCGHDYNHAKIIKPMLRFIIATNINSWKFDDDFNKIVTHLHIDCDFDAEDYVNCAEYFEKNIDSIMDFIKNY